MTRAAWSMSFEGGERSRRGSLLSCVRAPPSGGPWGLELTAREGLPLAPTVSGHSTNTPQRNNSWAPRGSFQHAELVSSRPALASRGCFCFLSWTANEVNANSHTCFCQQSGKLLDQYFKIKLLLTLLSRWKGQSSSWDGHQPKLPPSLLPFAHSQQLRAYRMVLRSVSFHASEPHAGRWQRRILKEQEGKHQTVPCVSASRSWNEANAQAFVGLLNDRGLPLHLRPVPSTCPRLGCRSHHLAVPSRSFWTHSFWTFISCKRREVII